MTTAPPLRVGQIVVVSLGGADQDAVVVEDYGALGEANEQLVRVLVLDSPIEYRVPASLVRVDNARLARARGRLTKAAARALERAYADDPA